MTDVLLFFLWLMHFFLKKTLCNFKSKKEVNFFSAAPKVRVVKFFSRVHCTPMMSTWNWSRWLVSCSHFDLNGGGRECVEMVIEVQIQTDSNNLKYAREKNGEQYLETFLFSKGGGRARKEMVHHDRNGKKKSKIPKFFKKKKKEKKEKCVRRKEKEKKEKS